MTPCCIQGLGYDGFWAKFKKKICVQQRLEAHSSPGAGQRQAGVVADFDEISTDVHMTSDSEVVDEIQIDVSTMMRLTTTSTTLETPRITTNLLTTSKRTSTMS